MSYPKNRPVGQRTSRRTGVAGSLFIVGVLPLFWMQNALGVIKPASRAASRLEDVLVEVNGQPRLVGPDRDLLLVKGDKLVIRSVHLAEPGRAAPVTNVDFIGFINSNHRDRYLESAPPAANDDRNFLIDTGKDLRGALAVDHKGRRFEIRVESKGRVQGRVYVRLVEPQLYYADVNLNGSVKTLRPNEVLFASPGDRLKVTRVASNLTTSNDVAFSLVPADQPGHYEIRFLRDGKVFARIPVIPTKKDPGRP